MRSTLLLCACWCVVSTGVGPVAAEPAVVVLVRHAEKAAAPADDPPLTVEGNARAAALAAALADVRIDAVVTTQFVRTQRTAAVAAADRRLTPLVIEAGRDAAAHVTAVAAAVRARPAGEAVLVVGHSNTVPAIIGALGGPTLPALCDTEYSNLFVLLLTPGSARLVRAHFGTPDAPAAGDCNRVMKQGR
jgi:broad specificity phosphatase PhoE